MTIRRLLIVSIVVGAATLLAVTMNFIAWSQRDAHADVQYIHGVIVQVGDRQIPCVVASNEFHVTNGGGVDCDWSRP